MNLLFLKYTSILCGLTPESKTESKAITQKIMSTKPLSFVRRVNSITNPRVFWLSNALLFLIMLLAVLKGEKFATTAGALKDVFLKNTGWFFVFAIIWLLYFVGVIFFKFGNIKLGQKNDQPEFSTLSWIAMLFSAGLGIGLLYSGTYEPMFHYFNAPQVASLAGPERFLQALKITYFHWGVPAWLIYSATGLVFAFVAFNQNRGMVFSGLVPKQYPRLKNALDVFAVLSILIGVIITFTLGVSQINTGLKQIFASLPFSKSTQVGLILIITLMATVSVFSGLKKGIKYLSQLNIYLALGLLLLTALSLPLADLAGLGIETLGVHVADFIKNLTYTAALKDKTWLRDWSIFYWAWWASWAPFVGLFIARISKGRTLKEYVVCTVLVPSLICFVWFTVFGYAGLKLHSQGLVDMEALVQKSPQSSLFATLQLSKLPFISSLLAVVSVFIFYITSSDSGSYVVDMITSGGKPAPHKYLKIYWSFMEGLLAAVLLYFGGVFLIKNLVILFAAPIILYICFGIYRVFRVLEK